MDKIITLFLSLLLINSVQAIDVVPLPNKVDVGGESFQFNENTKWIVEDKEQEAILQEVIERFRIAANFNYSVCTKGKGSRNSVCFITNDTFSEESYAIDVNSKNIRIQASGQKGFYYALQTFTQLLPVEINENKRSEAIVWKIQGVKIEDHPRFGYRGFMLDVSRYFMPKDNLIQLIDYLSMHKINFLHLHLVDDNGWRIEIKKYPKLTNFGAWHADREAFFSMREITTDGEPTPVGGYYTQEDIKEIVSYAQSRFVQIIPEIEMPAHTMSSLAAYPNLTCPVVKGINNVLPGMGGHKSSVIYCAGNDEVFEFLENVIDEVTELFPSEYIHIGGDEAWKANWEKCPLCQERIRKEGLKDEEALQGYFINRMAQYIKSKGKKLMGWDELTNSDIPEGTTIFGWRGMGQAALKAADKGHPFILSPARALYFIRYQGPQWFEPYTYFGNNTLLDVYDYEPTNNLNSGQKELLKGIESCLWSEFVNNPNDAEYLIFPRLAAFAEVGWTLPENKNWEEFLTRLDRLEKVYYNLGINYARSMYNLFHRVNPVDGRLKVNLSCIRPDVEIRYTLDGSEPSVSSQLYNEPFFLDNGETPRAATFKNDCRMGEILTLNCRYNLATGKKVTSNLPNSYLLTNGLLGSEKNTDGEYVDLYNRDGDFIIDLDAVTSFDNVVLCFLNNSGASVHLPAKIKLSVSDDGVNYRIIMDKDFSVVKCFSKGISKKQIKFDIQPTQAQFLKVELVKPGACPRGHVREGQFARIAVDEVILN